MQIPLSDKDLAVLKQGFEQVAQESYFSYRDYFDFDSMMRYVTGGDEKDFEAMVLGPLCEANYCDVAGLSQFLSTTDCNDPIIFVRAYKIVKEIYQYYDSWYFILFEDLNAMPALVISALFIEEILEAGHVTASMFALWLLVEPHRGAGDFFNPKIENGIHHLPVYIKKHKQSVLDEASGYHKQLELVNRLNVFNLADLFEEKLVEFAVSGSVNLRNATAGLFRQRSVVSMIQQKAHYGSPSERLHAVRLLCELVGDEAHDFFEECFKKDKSNKVKEMLGVFLSQNNTGSLAPLGPDETVTVVVEETPSPGTVTTLGADDDVLSSIHAIFGDHAFSKLLIEKGKKRKIAKSGIVNLKLTGLSRYKKCCDPEATEKLLRTFERVGHCLNYNHPNDNLRLAYEVVLVATHLVPELTLPALLAWPSQARAAQIILTMSYVQQLTQLNITFSYENLLAWFQLSPTSELQFGPVERALTEDQLVELLLHLVDKRPQQAEDIFFDKLFSIIVPTSSCCYRDEIERKLTEAAYFFGDKLRVALNTDQFRPHYGIWALIAFFNKATSRDAKAAWLAMLPEKVAAVPRPLLTELLCVITRTLVETADQSISILYAQLYEYEPVDHFGFGGDAILRGALWTYATQGFDDAERAILRYYRKSSGRVQLSAIYAFQLRGGYRALVYSKDLLKNNRYKENLRNPLFEKSIGFIERNIKDDYSTLDLKDGQTFDLGPRQLNCQLTPALKLLLMTQDNQTLKRFPVCGKSDDPEKHKAAHEKYSALKKNHKKVIIMLKQSLQNRMLTGYQWTADEWQKAFLQHPVSSAFAQGLMWTVWGDESRIFRPTEDGTLVNAQDETLPLPQNAPIILWHPAYACDAEIGAWQQHFDDYELLTHLDQPLLPCLPHTFEKTLKAEVQRDLHELTSQFTAWGYDRYSSFNHDGVFTYGGWHRLFGVANLKVTISRTVAYEVDITLGKIDKTSPYVFNHEPVEAFQALDELPKPLLSTLLNQLEQVRILLN